MSFKIIVDSCCDLTPAMCRDGSFLSVPLTIQVGEQTFVDDPSLDCSQLLAAMKASSTGATSACPSPAQYMDAMDCGADEIYVVTLSALLSGSHNSAVQARALFLEEHPEKKVHVFNSCSASSGEVLTALRIWNLARSGMEFSAVVEAVAQYISEMNTLFVLEDLDNLRKNGRLSRLQAILTGTLRVKLLMGSTPEGEICKRGQALSVKQALSKMVSLIAADLRHMGRTLCITHCNCLDRVFYLKELLWKECSFQDILVCETGGISTLYANDGGIVVAY